MRLAGQHSFSVTKKTNSGVIKWQVDREETDENSGAPLLFKNILKGMGATISFDLPKISGKQTVYFVSAWGKDFHDKQKIQVFDAGVPSTFDYKSAGNPDVHTFIVVPKTLNSKTRLIFVMSGLKRNADEYINSWKDWAANNNYIAVSPTFDEENWGGSRGYNLGNVFTEDEGKGKLNPKSKWSFTLVEGIHQAIRDGFSLSDREFDIFGHSAGAQFIHRLLLFCPELPVRLAIAANAGWYTLPDLSLAFSYGLKHPLLYFTKTDLQNWTNRKLIIMRGTADVLREGVLRKTSEADAQGQNRYERAAYMFNKAKALNPQTIWELIDVKGVNHDQKGMAVAAQKLLQKRESK